MASDAFATPVGGILSAIQAVIGDRDAPSQLATDPRAWLVSRGVEGEDATRMAESGARGLILYRKLVRRGLTSAIRLEIPRTAARLEGSFDGWVSRYFEEDLPRSHYVRDVAFEFLGWAAPQWSADRAVPRYLADLARHELSAFEIAGAESRGAGLASAELAIDRAARFDPSSRLYRYDYAVHRLEEAESARDEAEAIPTYLLGYRDPEHEVRYLALSALAFGILTRLLRGEPLGEAIHRAAADAAEPIRADVLEGTASLLADLAERGVLLGAEPAHGGSS
jgi:hypothetical protein